MELSESVQAGLRSVADPATFTDAGFPALLEASFRSLLSAAGDPGVLDLPELQHVDRLQLKLSHAAVVTFILEATRHSADRSTVSSCLEELNFSADRIELFYNSFQTHKKELTRQLASIGRRAPHINDVSWRLQYHMKNAQVDKVNEPVYLISLNTENAGVPEDVNFTCTVEQLQDLVGKLKDAAKSMEKAIQM